MSRFQKTVIALLAALVVVVAVAAGVIVKQQNDAASHAAYLQCMAIRGYTPQDAPTTYDELDGAIDAAEECSE